MTTKLAHNQLTNAPVKPFETMALAIADTTLVVGDVLLIRDRAS